MKDQTLFQKPVTYLITKGNLTDRNYAVLSAETLKIVSKAVETEINLIQVREKKLSPEKLLNLTERIVASAENSDTKILVNTHLEIAVSAGADGVHLPSGQIHIQNFRKRIPRHFLIGVSTHTFEQAEKSASEKADFIVYSPIFEPISKDSYGRPKGLKNLRKICGKIENLPVLALGGVRMDNFERILQAGAGGFAGIGFFNSPENLDKIALWKKRLLTAQPKKSV